MYSVGFFPDESGAISPDHQPGLRMPGMLLHPDKYDGLRYPRRTTRLLLTADRFELVKRHVEQLQADRGVGSLAFGLIDRSCVWFLADVAAVAGVEIDATYDLLRAAIDRLPDPIRMRCRSGRAAVRRRSPVWGRVRSTLGPVVAIVYGTVFNAGLAALGGRRVESIEWIREPDGTLVARRVDGLRPLFAGWRSVVGPAVPFFHVRALIEWQTRVGPELAPDAEPPDRT